MATKSIFKNVVIKDRQLARNLASALENAQNKKNKPVTLSKSCIGIKKDQIKDFWGDSTK